MREPEFEELGDGFKVILFRKVVNENTKVSNVTENLSNGLVKMGNALEEVSNEDQKVISTFDAYIPILEKAKITPKFIENIKIVFDEAGVHKIFAQADVKAWLDCSKSKATNVMNAMKEAAIIEKVKGFGPGKYRFTK